MELSPSKSKVLLGDISHIVNYASELAVTWAVSGPSGMSLECGQPIECRQSLNEHLQVSHQQLTVPVS